MRIKRYITIAFVAGVLLSCSKSETTKDDADNVPKQISFLPKFATSKGVTTDNANASSVGIYGYYTGTSEWATVTTTAEPNLLDNQELKRELGAWVGPTKLYWPMDQTTKISFLAYAPRETVSNGIVMSKNGDPGAPYTCLGTPTLSFKVSSDVVNQTDLLVANPQIDMNKNTNGGVVNLSFAHMLTKIGFKAFCRTPGTTIKSLSISNLKYKGSMSLDGTNTWTIENSKTNFSLELNGLPLSTIKDTPTDLSSPNNFFLMLPQNLIGSTDVILTVAYTEKGVVKTKSIGVVENWTIGKSIGYLLDFGGSDTEELIITSVSIEDWVVDAPVDLETN